MTAQGAPATCNSTSAATCIFQYQYTVPASPSLGGWTVRVTGNEGVEGTVTDLGVGTFTVAIPQPSLTILKTSTVLSDPVNNTTNPKRIPLAVVRYDVTVTNSGPGTVDADTLVITDPIPADSVDVRVDDVGRSRGVREWCDRERAHLQLRRQRDVFVRRARAGPWTYTPVPDANGFDAAVRARAHRAGGRHERGRDGKPVVHDPVPRADQLSTRASPRLHRIEAISAQVHPSWDVTFQTGCQTADLRG